MSWPIYFGHSGENTQCKQTVTSEYVQLPALRLHYRAQGDKDGPPLLLIHGSFGSSRWWLPLMELLPDAVFAVAPDLRGCGDSDKPDSGYNIAQMADDLWHFVSAMGLSNIDLVGHATGGAVAVEYALHHLENLHSLTLVDSVPLEGARSPVETLALLAQMRDDRALLSRAIRSLMPSLAQNDDDAIMQAYMDSLVDVATEMAPAAFTEVAASVSAWNRSDDARRLTLPTLLVLGSMDHIVERDAVTRSLIAIPGANNLEIIHGVGHCPMIEAPLTFAEILINFIADDFANQTELDES